MRSSFKSAVDDPFIRDLIRLLTLVAAVVITAIGIKALVNFFRK